MGKKQVEEHIGNLRDALPDYSRAQIDQYMAIVGGILAALPGGDSFEDVGYEPFEHINWREMDLIAKALNSIDSSMDVEHAYEILIGQDMEDEEEDWD